LRQTWKIVSPTWPNRNADIWFRSSRRNVPGFRYRGRTARNEIQKSACGKNNQPGEKLKLQFE
jgi:hypothetical protein